MLSAAKNPGLIQPRFFPVRSAQGFGSCAQHDVVWVVNRGTGTGTSRCPYRQERSSVFRRL